jgi:hypothetical protein
MKKILGLVLGLVSTLSLAKKIAEDPKGQWAANAPGAIIEVELIEAV